MSSERIVLRALVCGAIAVGLEEAARAGAAAGGGGTGAIASAAITAFGITGGALVALALVLGLLADRPEARSYASFWARALAGADDDSHRELGGLAATMLVVGAALIGLTWGRKIGKTASANVAVTVTVSTTLTCLAIGAAAFAIIVRALGKRLRRAEARWPWLAKATARDPMLVWGTVAACAGAAQIVPREYSVALGVGMIVASLALASSVAPRLAARVRGKKLVLLVAVPLLVLLVTPSIWAASSPTTREAVLRGAPLSVVFVSAAQRVAKK